MQDISVRNLTIGAGALKAALASYTRRIRYQKALAAGGAHYDLNGEVTAEQQNNAEESYTEEKKSNIVNEAADIASGIEDITLVADRSTSKGDVIV